MPSIVVDWCEKYMAGCCRALEFEISFQMLHLDTFGLLGAYLFTAQNVEFLVFVVL